MISLPQPPPFGTPTIAIVSPLAQLSAHRSTGPEEEDDRIRMIAFAQAHPNPFDRSIPEGHFTGSGLVMSADGSKVLLLYHRKLKRWLQPGGHGEANEDRGEVVASREVAEETGLEPRLHPTAPRPFDVDIHTIPARGTEAAHEHLDLRYLFLADPGETLRGEGGETTQAPTGEPSLRWLAVQEALAMDLDPGLKRMIRKAAGLLMKSNAPARA